MLKAFFLFLEKGAHMFIDKRKLAVIQDILKRSFQANNTNYQQEEVFYNRQIWLSMDDFRCPLCGGKHCCLINSNGTKVICYHTMSDKKVGSHSWLHQLIAKNALVYKK